MSWGADFFFFLLCVHSLYLRHNYKHSPAQLSSLSGLKVGHSCFFSHAATLRFLHAKDEIQIVPWLAPSFSFLQVQCKKL